MLNMLLLPENKDVEFGVIHNDKLNCFDFELTPDDRITDHDNGQPEANNISFKEFDELVKTGQLYEPANMLC